MLCIQIEIDTDSRRNYASKRLRTARQGTDDIVSYTSFIVKLPDDSSHANHVTGEVSNKVYTTQFVYLFSLQKCGNSSFSKGGLHERIASHTQTRI